MFLLRRIWAVVRALHAKRANLVDCNNSFGTTTELRRRTKANNQRDSDGSIPAVTVH